MVGHWEESSSYRYISRKGIRTSKALAVSFHRLGAAATLDEVIGLVTSRHLPSPAIAATTLKGLCGLPQ
jgi:hypothetical protein